MTINYERFSKKNCTITFYSILNKSIKLIYEIFELYFKFKTYMSIKNRIYQWLKHCYWYWKKKALWFYNELLKMYRTKTFIFKKLIDYVNQLKKRNYNYDIFETSFRKKRRRSIIMSILQISKTNFWNQKYQQYQSFLFLMLLILIQFQLLF